MKASALKYTILTVVATLIALTFYLVPFHAFLTIWLSSNFGHYTAFRLWKEVFLCISLLGALYLVIFDNKIRSHTLTRRLVQLMVLYGLVNIVWGLVAYHHHDVDLKALGYGLIVNLRFLGFFLVCWAIALRTTRLRAHWSRFVFYPAALVILVGLLQYFVLPTDFLRHFGYGPNTIFPYETINHNIHYIRIMSTLRGANPLGAYLIVPISAMVSLVARAGFTWKRSLFLAASVVVLYASFSRSAWVGALVSSAVIIVVCKMKPVAKKIVYALSAGVIVVLAVLGIALHNNTKVQNIVLHTQSHSAVASTSNGGHLDALKAGAHDVLHQPLGRGPGSAGPASVYNNHPARIAENYFLQIGQETGWIGLLLFVVINLGVGYLLWVRRADPLALSLFGSLIGLTVVNMLSHAWADDTLSYVWWGLAGIAMVAATKKEAHAPEATK